MRVADSQRLASREPSLVALQDLFVVTTRGARGSVDRGNGTIRAPHNGSYVTFGPNVW